MSFERVSVVVAALLTAACAGSDGSVRSGGIEVARVHGLSTGYRVTLLKPDRTVRFERTYEPVRVAAGERAEEEARITRNMRLTEPGWRWDGPPIPDVKPPFRDIFAGADGRIWVRVHQTAVDVGDPFYDPKDPDALEDRWREPVVFDVFEEDGTYDGRVFTPMGFQTSPTPVFGETLVWATTRDDLGVQRVVRFRIQPGPVGLSTVP